MGLALLVLEWEKGLGHVLEEQLLGLVGPWLAAMLLG